MTEPLNESPRALHLVSEVSLDSWLAAQPASVAHWAKAQQFAAERHRVVLLPDASGAIVGAVAGIGAGDLALPDPWWFAALPDRLPAADYQLATPLTEQAATALALGWRLGCYRLARWRSGKISPRARLIAPPNADLAWVAACDQALTLARDLINAPPNEMGPAELATACTTLAQQFGASCAIVDGAALATQYPLIQAVGAGSPRAPRLIDLRWNGGGADAPRVTLVGKGVCFDTGGLDLKDPSGMLMMKKDMGGAACALGTAALLMAMQAPVRLRVLIPAVENSVDGFSYRPSDVLRSRKGLNIEIGNTDAEGRLVLADALSLADDEKPALLVDFATLTGAARVALGPELPAAFSPDASLLADLQRCGDAERDPLWPMPLWAGYDEDLGSKIADLNNVAAHSFAGSVVAALFLKRFVTATPQWLHLDLYAWNAKDRPGRPVGAEAQCVRAVYRLVRQRYG